MHAIPLKHSYIEIMSLHLVAITKAKSAGTHFLLSICNSVALSVHVTKYLVQILKFCLNA